MWAMRRMTYAPTSSVADRARPCRRRQGVGRRRPGHLLDHAARHDDLDRGAPTRLAGAGEGRPDTVRSCPHAGQSEMAIGDGRRVEPLAVVDDGEADAVAALAHLQPDLPRGGVLDDVVEGLLGDAVEHFLDGQGEADVQVALD